MALLARIKSPEWIDGDILTAADLIAEFNNIVNGLNGTADISVLDITCDDITADDITCDDISAGDLTLSGNAAVTGNVSITGNFTSAQKELGRIDNLGLSLASGVLKLVDASGANLSVTNYGYVVMPSTTAGQSVSLKINANTLSIQDAAGTSDLTNLEFGITAAVAWANDMPFYIYIVNKGNNHVDGTDGNSAVFISRNPAMVTTPSSTNSIGDTDAIAVTDDQLAIMLMGSYTQANYTSLPCQLIGAFRMRYATNDWTIQTLSNTYDGLGRVALEKSFSTTWTMPISQNGATSGKYLLDNSGTAPTFTTSTYLYRLDRSGKCNIQLDFVGNTATDGVSSVDTILATPYAHKNASIYTVGSIYLQGGSGSGIDTVAFVQMLSAATQAKFYYTTGSATTQVQNDAFSDGNRALAGTFEYAAF